LTPKERQVMYQWFNAISIIMFMLLVFGYLAEDLALLITAVSWFLLYAFVHIRIQITIKQRQAAYLKQLRESDMNAVDHMTGRQFELYLEVLFQALGYGTEQLPTTNDFGADLILTTGETRIAVQAKRYKGNVGNRAVQMILGAKKYYQCDAAWIVTNSFYTKAAIQMASKTDVVLVDRNGLLDLMTKRKTLPS
jgi:restriction system protein